MLWSDLHWFHNTFQVGKTWTSVSILELFGFFLSSNFPLLAARDEFEFACYQLHRRVSQANVIPFSLLQGEFIFFFTAVGAVDNIMYTKGLEHDPL
jgi:hypothetical protein